MASETTTKADLIVPEVWADAVGPTILGKTVMAPLADQDDTLVGQPGDTVSFPKFGYIGDAEDLTEGVAMETDKLTASDTFATIKEVGKALEMTDSATLAALGNPNSQARIQIALSVARKVDADLITAAQYTHTNGGAEDPEATTAPLSLAVTTPLSWNVLTRAFALWGDEYDPDEVAAIVVRSEQNIQLMNDPNFLSADKFGAGAVLLRGQVGAIGRIAVIVSDRLPTVTDVDGGTAGNQAGAKALLIRRGSLALKHKRRPIVETDRDILKRTNIVTTNAHYAVKRVDDRGIIVLTTSAAIPTS